MRSGWLLLVWMLGSQTAAAADDVAAILSDLTSVEAPCAGQIEALDAAVVLHPADRSARRARGVCLYQLGRLELAGADLDQALESVSTVSDVEPLVVGAILAARDGRDAVARARLARAEAVGGAASAQVVRGTVVVRGSLGDFPGAWAALDQALERNVEDPVLLVAATEMIALDPDGATPTARAAIGRRVKTVTRHNRASGWLNAGQPAACVHEAEGALAEADSEDAEAIAALHVLAWRCAVAAGQVGPATRHLKAMGRAALADQPPGTVIAHVRLLRDAGEAATALKMLGLVRPESDVDRREVATLVVGLNTLRGDLDAALGAANEQASPVSRANLAKALHAAGRTTDAVAVLERTCSALEDPPTCETWLEHLRNSR
jgi:tetratricopeptide (TPR) repeat protein